MARIVGRSPSSIAQRRTRKPARTEAQRKRNAMKPLPHPYARCADACCDTIRAMNAGARAMLGWAADYPPAFYAGADGGAVAEWEAANAGVVEEVDDGLGVIEPF